jgi:myosin-5
MKYLAALSQRAASQQSQPVERAYKKVAENKAMRSGSANGASLSSSSSGVQSFVPMSPISGSSTPSWVKKTLKTMTQSDKMDTGSDPDRSVGGSNALSDVTNLAGVGSSAMNSIEAQVLQSNPILESFGNARTMRNDNSSRFGKFIEIQFTRTGRLVGAQIETYLLEKVRLVTQAMGERNYHIFYEMLSGGMPADELRNYYIASTATADDFRMTASGTYDRRDGVSDKETYRALRTAMRTMKISEEEQQDVFATAAALLHASNLSFCDLGDQKSALDGRNIHLEPVCRLLGVSTEALNQALCHFTISAGNESQVQQNLDVDRAEKGLEALLKTTYGALFDFLVARINDSICFTPDDSRQDESRDEPSSPVPIYGKKEAPAASIGVLDIFGFESFQSNSFEQLCINYCNEALQQQFNAFVLKNEQAEYEREGIEWSFIQFPENQDVLDLIDKRGSGILCILDDQCRAPGTSDRSFALDVYNKCKNHVRFSANRKQTAVLQFCVHHYAGPVEYTTDGFVEKNRDELPKEATDLLQNSFNPFIRLMAEIIESTAAERAASSSKTNTPKVFRRQESNIGRATVGGQFRRQLKCLREKIDRMAPHYVRCLKPNDELVPNHFDRAAVAEQLRCGGILEAVRVARAGYSNHYSHEDFLRRYRCLGRNELKEGAASTSVVECRPTAQKKFTAAAVNSYLQNKDTSTGQASSSGKKPSTNPSTIALCTALVKVLCKKLQQQKDDNDENENYSNTYPTQSLSSTPTSNKYQVFAAPPAWARGGTSMRGGRTGGLPPVPFTSTSKTWEKSSNDSRPPTNPEKNRQSFKNVGSSSSTSESAKVGIQIGKTKVFLRHKAFEALERLRSQEQSRAATKLNSVFRMFLARVAYVHVRNAVRKSMYDLRAYEDDEFKECKDQSLDDEQLLAFFNRLNKMRHSYNGQSFSLVELWATQMRESIHNPRPRSEWGKIDPSRPFKWTLVDGLWTKNHDFDD